MDARAQAAAVRRSAGLFRLPRRGVIGVGGADARRWLQGMLSNDVAGLAPGPRGSGCYATLLTPAGRIVADLQVLLRPTGFWLDLERAVLPTVLARLEKLVIADDVTLADLGPALARLGVEGPRAQAVLERALGMALDLAPDAVTDVPLAGVSVAVSAFGWSGEPAFQLFVPTAQCAAVEAALREAAGGAELVGADCEALEILRVEAGVPRAGAELTEDVLPPEARLERAISYTKGCYTGQEILARLRTRGEVKHLLVGLRFSGGAAPPVGAAILVGGERVGEITSAAISPSAGPIALGFVRRPHDAPGTAVEVEDRTASVSALPFLGLGCAV